MVRQHDSLDRYGPPRKITPGSRQQKSMENGDPLCGEALDRGGLKC